MILINSHSNNFKIKLNLETTLQTNEWEIYVNIYII